MSETEQDGTFEAPDPEEIARLFPAFEVHSLIACGGMGAVYRATQRSLDREVAIKILPREFSKDDSFRAGFESEAKAMGKLNHPNLVGVYDFGEVDGMLYIVMEYVHGQSLFHAANGNAVEQGEALRLIVDICRGLGHAHKHGVLHRDIKPANILLDESLQPKIADFGLARALAHERKEGEQIFGTPGYTAPEVTTPPFDVDHRADIFSVGVMLYELLTGKSPVTENGSPIVPQLADLRINSVIKKATHPNPESRYDSTEKLAEDLVKIATESEQDAGRSEALQSAASKKSLPSAAARKAMLAKNAGVYAPKTYTQKKSSSGGILILLLIAILGGVVFILLRKSPTKPEAPVAETKKKEPRVIVIGDPQPKRAKSAALREATYSPIIPMISSSGPVIQGEFNTGEFLEKARNVLGASVVSDARAYQNGVEENTKAFQAELKGLIADWEDGRRQEAEQSLTREAEDWSENNNLIPKELPVGFRESFTAREIHEKYLEKQQTLREPLDRKVSEQVEPYILGLEFQIEVLKDTDNETAIEELEKEIEKVKDNSRYFVSLMLD